MFEDPRTRAPHPPFPQASPGAGAATQLDPKPDHGEGSYVGHQRLEGCGTIVIGGDSGIGRAVAIAFAREGADILVAYHTAESEAAETARWVHEAGRKALLIGGNLEGEPLQRHIIEQAVAQFGHLDILVNDAVASWPHESTQQSSALELEEALRKSTEAVFGLARLAASRMKPGASIITTTALRSSHPSSQQRAYGAFQGGVAALTASLALELAQKGIRINAVEPGPVWAPRVLTTLTDEQRRNFGADTMLGRPGQPAELAPAYVFLASAEASFITGSVLSVTGGRFDRFAPGVPGAAA